MCECVWMCVNVSVCEHACVRWELLEGLNLELETNTDTILRTQFENFYIKSRRK